MNKINENNVIDMIEDDNENDENEEDELNIENYNIEDLIKLLNITELNEFGVLQATRPLLAKAKSRENQDIYNFLLEARNKVLEYINESANEDANEGVNEGANESANEGVNVNERSTDEVLKEWLQHQYPIQAGVNSQIQNMKPTDRYQKIQTFNGNTHFQMNRERLGVNQSYVIPTIQDQLNPTLRNINTRVLNIDSQYRSNILPYANNDINQSSYSTDFTLQLSEPLQNVLSMYLYSIQIPTTWYAIDHIYGNTCLEISGSVVHITEGNYTIEQFTQEWLSNVNAVAGVNIDLSYNPINGKYTIINTDSSDVSIIFYRPEGFNDPLCNQCNSNQYINQHMGWTMGYRIEPDVDGVIELDISGNTSIEADVPADLYGPKYCILVVDDYNHNRQNMGLVNINKQETKLSIPNYRNVESQICNANNEVEYVETAPRRLTKSQLFTMNRILEERKISNTRPIPPTPSDVLATIPFRNLQLTRPGPYVDYGTVLLSNNRDYYGPVQISKLRVRLLDDKGNPMNLHDNDWSFVLHIRQLYQY